MITDVLEAKYPCRDEHKEGMAARWFNTGARKSVTTADSIADQIFLVTASLTSDFHHYLNT